MLVASAWVMIVELMMRRIMTIGETIPTAYYGSLGNLLRITNIECRWDVLHVAICKCQWVDESLHSKIQLKS